jgi:hypothetical protein
LVEILGPMVPTLGGFTWNVPKPKVSVQNPKVSGEIFELETSVKVVFRNASVAGTQNFELLFTQFYKD